MKTKKQPISFNPGEQKEVQEASDFYGLGDINRDYGSLPKTVKLSITLSKELPILIEKFIPDLEPEKLDLLLSSIKKIKLDKYKQKEVEKLQKKA